MLIAWCIALDVLAVTEKSFNSGTQILYSGVIIIIWFIAHISA